MLCLLLPSIWILSQNLRQDLFQKWKLLSISGLIRISVKVIRLPMGSLAGVMNWLIHGGMLCFSRRTKKKYETSEKWLYKGCIMGVFVVTLLIKVYKWELEKFFRKKYKCPHPRSRQICHSCTQHVIWSCPTFVPSIIKIFRRVFVLQSRDKKSNSNTRRGDNSKSKKSQSCHSCMWHVVWSCSSLLPSIIKIFQRVFDLHSGH